MAINLKAIIEDDSAVKEKGFSGAVFLTYTLNLGFYEQIIAPALERAGCSNVLIIADPDGYAEAIEMGQKNVAYAGMRYVCTPFPRKGNGVQHVKLLLMAGENRGRLLIGSGNLTLHGYSRNLEIYSHFEYDHKNPDEEAKLAINSSWTFLNQLISGGCFTSAAQKQLNAISGNVRWLDEHVYVSNSCQIWNNYQNPLWAQFIEWRNKNGFGNKAINSLKVFSPYFDHDLYMLNKFANTLLPDDVSLYVSKENTTLNPQGLITGWQKDISSPQLFDIREIRENQSQRLLHAKIIVGIEDNGAWCIAGSANMTKAAFENSWQNGSNLELVTLRWSDNPSAFDYLFENQISVTPIDINSIISSDIPDNSENPRIVTEETIFLSELTLKNDILCGRVNHWPEPVNQDVELILCRSGKHLWVNLNSDLYFEIPFLEEIRASEYAYIKCEKGESLPRWIDIPAILEKYGSRSYSDRIQAKLDTIIGAESLFHELMDFLFDRINPDEIDDENKRQENRHSRTNKSDQKDSDDQTVTPDADRFVVPERDASGSFRVGNYTRVPYDKNIRSLRDLLSIVLLKLTSDPEISTETRIDENEGDTNRENTDQQVKEAEENQINARQRLCRYLVDYCNTYSKRLCQQDFIEQISPAVLFDNHLTLSRIILEFWSHIIEFSEKDLAKCCGLIWAPLFSPHLAELQNKSCWQMYKNNDTENKFIDAWNKLDISKIFVVMISLVYQRPPSYSTGFYKSKNVSKYLAIKGLINELEKHIEIDIPLDFDINHWGISKVDWNECVEIFKCIKNYVTPARERLSPIFEWIENKDDHIKQQQISEKIKQTDLAGEFSKYRMDPKVITEIVTKLDDEGLVYCPRCGGSIHARLVSELNRGKLILCSTTSDVWIYKTEEPANTII